MKNKTSAKFVGIETATVDDRILIFNQEDVDIEVEEDSVTIKALTIKPGAKNLNRNKGYFMDL